MSLEEIERAATEFYDPQVKTGLGIGEGPGETSQEVADEQATEKEPQVVDLLEEEILTKEDEGWLEGAKTCFIGAQAEHAGLNVEHYLERLDSDEEVEDSIAEMTSRIETRDK